MCAAQRRIKFRAMHGSLILNSQFSILNFPLLRPFTNQYRFLRLPLLSLPIDVKLLRATTQ